MITSGAEIEAETETETETEIETETVTWTAGSVNASGRKKHEKKASRSKS